MKIKNYGELLSAGLNMELLAYQTYGSYQGDYIAILAGDNKICLYKGSYGSCSGCDWFEANSEYTSEGDEVTEEKVKEYTTELNPFLVIEEDKIDTILGMEDISQIFPANKIGRAHV